MCNNPYMPLSHYEILACGTALWKLLDSTVFAQGLLINFPLNDRVCPNQTAYVSDAGERQGRERGRKVDRTREACYHSSVTIYRRSILRPPVRTGSISLSLCFSNWMVQPRHLFAPLTAPCCSLHLCSFVFTPTFHFIYSSSFDFLVSLTTSFQNWFAGTYHSTPTGSNGL